MGFKNFAEFYPYYLRVHSNRMCRKLHFFGTCCVVSLLVLFFFTGQPMLLAIIPLVGYGFAWVGHLIYEKNQPATFEYPLYSILADFRMFWDILTGKVRAF